MTDMADTSCMPEISATIPMAVKLPYTLFVAMLIPVYWQSHGLENFLWFSDIALFGTTIVLWTRHKLLASTLAVLAVALDLGWCLDFILRATGTGTFFSYSAYMFDSSGALYLRILSLFHIGLPFFQLWLIHRLGYDRRALGYAPLLAVVVLYLCYGLTDPAVNINRAFGLGDQPQDMMPAALFPIALTAAMAMGIYLPTHLVLWFWRGRVSENSTMPTSPKNDSQ